MKMVVAMDSFKGGCTADEAGRAAMDELHAWLARLPIQHIGVVGDFAVDGYWDLRLEAGVPSLETGKRTQPIAQQRYAGGGAANVAMNLMALGVGRVSAFGVVGADPLGRELLRLLEGAGINQAGMVCQEQDWNTVTYIKPCQDGEEMARWDFGDFNQLAAATAERLLMALEACWPTLDALIINAQSPASIHTAPVQNQLATWFTQSDAPLVIADVRDPAQRYGDCHLKINEQEALRLCDASPATATVPADEQVRTAAMALQAAQQRPVFVTRGARGMLVADQGGVHAIPAIDLVGRSVDVTGAGDAALAGITAALVAGATTLQAARVGTCTAAIALQKLGETGQATPQELVALWSAVVGPSTGE